MSDVYKCLKFVLKMLFGTTCLCILGAGIVMVVAPHLFTSFICKDSMYNRIIGSSCIVAGGLGILVLWCGSRRRKQPVRPVCEIQSRKKFFGYFNPQEWGFSMFRFGHMIHNVSAYCEYAFHHKGSRPSEEELNEHLPIAEKAEQLKILQEPLPKGIRVLWIGHASLLVQIDGVNILFDPVFHDCGPLLCGRLISGYERFRPPAVTVDDLKDACEIHAVCISHNHYDHLDLRSVQELVAAFGDEIRWFVPKGMQRWFLDREIRQDKVEDMDWWESRKESLVNGPPCKIIFTPAKHWSLRGLRDYYCRHLWGSWFVEGPEGSKFYFAGDTGYVEEMSDEIKNKCGVPDVAAIPIGAYKPRPVMEAQHIDPEEALKIHIELGAKHSIGIHWGTFAMSNEKIHEPRRDLEAAIGKKKCEYTDTLQQNSNLNFIIMNHGEVRQFPPATSGE